MRLILIIDANNFQCLRAKHSSGYMPFNDKLCAKFQHEYFANMVSSYLYYYFMIDDPYYASEKSDPVHEINNARQDGKLAKSPCVMCLWRAAERTS